MEPPMLPSTNSPPPPDTNPAPGDLLGPLPHDPGGQKRFKLPAGMQSAARVSQCGRYQYRLERVWGGGDPAGPYALWIMCNPSSGGQHADDPTLVRVRQFSHDWGYRRMVVVDLFAFRCTVPADLPADDPTAIGPDNDATILASITDPACGIVVCGWGVPPLKKLADRVAARSAAVARLSGSLLHALAVTTNEGQPRHPLYVRRDQKPSFWTHPQLSAPGSR
jgi:hypothetical protein